MERINGFKYDRKAVKAGIAHIGVGNFHRAHAEFFTNNLLEYADQQQWGICGIALLPSDERLVSALKAQEGKYTLTVCGRDGKNEIYRIGSLVELLWGVESPEKVIAKLADASIKIISMTITEGGYNIDKATGRFVIEEEKVQHDIKNKDNPQTVFGYVAAGLRKRMQEGGGPVTILSCDNLQHNGKVAKLAFTTFIKAQDAELYDWVTTNVTFPNSMVDRITPAVREADRTRLNKESGEEDLAPVYCEDFIQWVIEDKFVAGRPEWERVGVEFTDDVKDYENMKLSLLNASHSMLSYPSFLSGYRKVDAAMHDSRIEEFVRGFMEKDVTPYVPAPKGTDLSAYKQTLIERFANKAVSDQISRLCFDGVSKIPVYIMPTLGKMLKDGADLTRVAFFFAVYRKYLQENKDDEGVAYTVDEPWLTDSDKALIADNDAISFLKLSPFKSVDLEADRRFVEVYKSMADQLKDKGVMQLLETII